MAQARVIFEHRGRWLLAILVLVPFVIAGPSIGALIHGDWMPAFILIAGMLTALFLSLWFAVRVLSARVLTRLTLEGNHLVGTRQGFLARGEAVELPIAQIIAWETYREHILHIVVDGVRLRHGEAWYRLPLTGAQVVDREALERLAGVPIPGTAR